ncbi:MAG: hypothetical protein Q4A72_06725 [Bacillota bacterium]|nr:hypothetical protein [Bacillota bacterium]
MKKGLCFVLTLAFLFPFLLAPVAAEGETEPVLQEGERQEGGGEAAEPVNEPGAEAGEGQEAVPVESLFSEEDLPAEYMVMDARTGDVLFAKNEHGKKMMGSMSSLMTAGLILQKYSAKDKISSPANFGTPPGVSIAVDSEEEFSVEQLIHALILSSANDVAETLAIAHSGSSKDFVKAMNDKALDLGLSETVFVSPYHLEDAGQLSSVNDVALMLKEVMKYELFRTASLTTEYSIPPTNKKSEERNYIRQTNAFLLDNGELIDYMGTQVTIFDPEVKLANLDVFSDGTYLMYTGTEDEKMPLLFVSAGAGNASTAYSKQKALMEKARTEYASYTLLVKGELVDKWESKNEKEGSLNMVAETNLSIILPKSINLEKDLVREVKRRDLTNVVVEKDVVIGELIFKYNGREVGKVNLVAEGGTGDSGFLGALSDEKTPKTPFEMLMSVAGLIIKIVLIFLIWTYVVARHRERLRRKRNRNNVSDMRDYKNQRNQY